MLASSTATQAQTQSFRLVHPQIYIICKRLGHVKGQVLLIQSPRISMTQDKQEETQ